MKNLLCVLALFVAGSALADVQTGLYVGTTPAGLTCHLVIQNFEFAGGIAHPLNERVIASYENESFTLMHAPQIDETKGTVRPEGGILKGAKGTPEGGLALVVKMTHSEDYHGPSEATLIRHNYKNAALSTKSVCKDIHPAVWGNAL